MVKSYRIESEKQLYLLAVMCWATISQFLADSKPTETSHVDILTSGGLKGSLLVSFFILCAATPPPSGETLAPDIGETAKFERRSLKGEVGADVDGNALQDTSFMPAIGVVD